ncbi:phospholipase D-like domain-containing protein DpdK [Chlorobium phaeovibrioides]|uniref:phospholipase D-like domain-containing protein DpdK n=1 Tax=Chlorobium phaeovibrioides TaxID=1094 RepID=UPI0012306E0B|nr:phospholipase D-like domain-containing protein DpdK [Chlorobium phaeovibrioides]QEQ57700.1 phosphatidylserine/phosphatidylglycerophosphate/cardiolipin synthase family protein [Chlorobium phaeovibrioides]
MTQLYRRIFKSQQTGNSTTRELLQSMFVGEYLHSVNEIWIVSPWLTNIALIDNRSGNFDSLNPSWGRREVRLVDVLVGFMEKGVKVFVVTRGIDINQPFINKVSELSEMHAVDDFLKVVLQSELHTKGILLSSSLLMGSMNLTNNGLEMNDEMIQFSIDPEDIAHTRLEFRKYLNENNG